MTEITIRGVLEYDKLGEEEFVSVKIMGYNPHGALIFEMAPEMGYMTDWGEFARACEKGGNMSEDYGPSNGSCEIEVRDGVISFTVAKYGDGAGGSLVFYAMASGCAAGFAQLAADLAEFQARDSAM